MQEQIENQAVAISLKASKLTARVLAKALAAVMRQIQKEHKKAQTPQGRQSVKKLMNHKSAVNTIPLDGDTRLFDRVARKWNVDYSFHKTGHNKHLLLFKAGQTDAITACFTDYTKRYISKANDKRISIPEQIKKLGEHERSKPPRERERKREVARDDR